MKELSLGINLMHLADLTMDIEDVESAIDKRLEQINNSLIKSTYYEHITNLIEKAKKENISNEDIQKFLFQDFKKYGLKTKLTFMYQYCDREENRLRGRVGNVAGWRVGTQAYKYMPVNQIPKNPNPHQEVTRYYDFGREGWRSFRNNMFVVISQFWNDKDQKWVDTPGELENGLKNVNWKYKRIEREDTEEEKTKRDLVKEREQEKKKREIEKTKAKMELQKGIDLEDFNFDHNTVETLSSLFGFCVIDGVLIKGEQSEAQKEKIAKTMKEFKEGDLKTASGEKVEDRKQAIAIALSQAEQINKSEDVCVWSVDGDDKDIDFFVSKYKKWAGEDVTLNTEPSEEGVFEFLQNNYQDLSPNNFLNKKLLQELKKDLEKGLTFSDYPQTAVDNAQKVLDWKEQYKDEIKGGTKIGWLRANEIANRKPLSLATVKRIYRFKKQKQTSSQGENPWEDSNQVASLLWGGQEMIDWAEDVLNKLDKNVLKKASDCIELAMYINDVEKGLISSDLEDDYDENELIKQDDESFQNTEITFTQKVVNYADAIVWNKNFTKILLLRRGHNDSFSPGKYSLPGGTVEIGETILEGVIRELKEETGLDFKEDQLEQSESFDNGNGSISHYFVTKTNQEDFVYLDNSEHDQYIWVNKDELLEIDTIYSLKDRLIEMCFKDGLMKSLFNNVKNRLSLFFDKLYLTENKRFIYKSLGDFCDKNQLIKGEKWQDSILVNIIKALQEDEYEAFNSCMMVVGDFLEKGKKANIGERRFFGGVLMQKMPDKTWKIVKKDKINATIDKTYYEKYKFDAKQIDLFEEMEIAVYGGRIKEKTDFFNNNFEGFDLQQYYKQLVGLFNKEFAKMNLPEKAKQFECELKFDFNSVEMVIKNKVKSEKDRKKYGIIIKRQLELDSSGKYFEKTDQKMLYNDVLFIGESLRSRQLGKQILSNIYQLAKNAGIQQIQLSAARIDGDEVINGANTWGLFGFVTPKESLLGSIIKPMENTADTTVNINNKPVTFSKEDYGGVVMKAAEWVEKHPDEKCFPMYVLHDYLKEKAFVALKDVAWRGKLDLTDENQREMYESKLRKKV